MDINIFKFGRNIFLFSFLQYLFFSSALAADIEGCLKEPNLCSDIVRQSPGDPKKGDIYKNYITINNNIKILLPQGLWEVNNTGEYKGDPRWHAPWHFITLVNLDKNSPLNLTFYDYFKINSDWKGWDFCKNININISFIPGAKVIENTQKGLFEKCSFLMPVDDTPLAHNSLKSHKFWKFESSNLTNDFINNLPKQAIIFESNSSKVNSLYIRQVIFLDHKKLQLDKNNIISKKLNLGLDHLQNNEKKLINWYVNYTNLSNDVFFGNINIDYSQVYLPVNPILQSPATIPIREVSQFESAQKDTAQKEAAQKEAALKDTAQKEAAQKEVALKEAALKEAALKEAALKEAALKEAALKEAAQKEAALKEAALKEAAQKEADQKLASQKEAAQKEAALKEARSNRKALIIGNDKYKNITQLKNAKFDADAIGSTLKSIGYKVLIKTDLNLHEMKSVIRQFKMDVEGGDEVVIFFAGHGVQLGGSNYLLPIDIVADSEEQIRDDAIQLQRILDDMSEKKVRLTLALVDACRDNPFPKTGRAIGGRGLAPTAAATGQMIIFSAGSGQQALDRLNANDQSKNSLFTRILIKEIKSPGVRIDNVIREVRKKVVEAAKSVGHEQVPAIYDQVVGDFYFVK